jgi:two-component system, OmpR family, KDP operon response regulator KdpE
MASDRAGGQRPDCSPASRAADPSASGSSVRPPSILLVDDDELNRTLVRTVLARSTDPPLGAAQLLEAADLAGARAILAERPVDMVLLDMRLPDGSGLELAAELKRSGKPDPPAVIALTGTLEPDMRGAAMSAGCTAALGKPYHVASLRELINAELCRRAALA